MYIAKTCTIQTKLSETEKCICINLFSMLKDVKLPEEIMIEKILLMRLKAAFSILFTFLELWRRLNMLLENNMFKEDE